ncbi:MAG: tetratricopeptide repeat protein [Emticicia sp.]|uniref:tetratricopeptide repeat protein n=1 Tax=Emticicia sp. TaxID=1930953 RepID=UPI003BA75D19
MTDDLINIDDYFQQKLSAEERLAFEEKLSTDPKFAEEVALYAHIKAIEREKVLIERHTEWKTLPVKSPSSINLSRISMGIAAMLAVVLSMWYFTRPTINQRADEYITSNLMTLQKTLDGTQDSLQVGIELYNKQQYQKASEIFEKLITKTPKAIEYLGLSAFQMKKYDAALSYFEKLANNTELLNNKGKFYQALVYIKQNKVSEAEALLKEVIERNLGGKKDAEKILE